MQECREIVERGRRAYESGQFQVSAGEFERALDVCPQRAQAGLALGKAQLMAGQVEASIESLRRITKLDPNNIEANKVLGDALYLAGKEAEAGQSLKAGLALDPTFQPPLYALGRLYYPPTRFPDTLRQFH